MRARVITVIIGAPLLLICCYAGGWIWALVCLALAALAAYELGSLFKQRDWTVTPPLDITAAMLLAGSFGLIRSRAWPFALAVLLTMLAYAWWMQYRRQALGQSLAQAAGILYIGVGFGALLALRLGSLDWLLILLTLLNVWITDTAAHLVGSRYGRHKLAPVISPHKTWEGALAGLGCASLICSIYISVALGLPFSSALPLAMLLSLLCQVGDLLESALKRWAGVKDSGYILPGHGGVLDRFDSMLFSAPFVLLLLTAI